MITWRFFPVVQVIALLASPIRTYPTQSYGRLQRSASSSLLGSSQTINHEESTKWFPAAASSQFDIYPSYTTAENNPPSDLDLFYQRPIVFYPQSSMYKVYQAVVPNYYSRPVANSALNYYYGYEDSDPVVALENELMEDEEREHSLLNSRGQREPFKYENAKNQDLTYNDETFLHNFNPLEHYSDYNDANYDVKATYGKLDRYPPPRNNRDQEVFELEQLGKPYANDDRSSFHQRGANRMAPRDKYFEKKRSFSGSRERLTNVAEKLTTEEPTLDSMDSTTSSATVKKTGDKVPLLGQKEEVLLRPSGPAKHTLVVPGMEILYKRKSAGRERQPSMYETIKHILDMEKKTDEKNAP